MNVVIFIIFIIILFGTFGLHLFHGMFEYRCRITEFPNDDGEWPLLDDYYKLCNTDDNNCPEGSWCGAPSNEGLEWDPEEINIIEFNYGLTGFDDI